MPALRERMPGVNFFVGMLRSKKKKEIKRNEGKKKKNKKKGRKQIRKENGNGKGTLFVERERKRITKGRSCAIPLTNHNIVRTRAPIREVAPNHHTFLIPGTLYKKKKKKPSNRRNSHRDRVPRYPSMSLKGSRRTVTIANRTTTLIKQKKKLKEKDKK